MERGFHSLLIAGKYAVGDDNFSSLANSDEAYINSDTSLQTLNFDKSLLSLMHYPYSSSYDYDTSDANLWSRKTGERSKEDNKWRCVEREENLKKLKNEPSTEQFNFTPASMFGQLPELQSMEQISHEKRHLKHWFSPISTTTYPHMTQFRLTPNYITPVLAPEPLRQIKPPPAKLSSTEQARRRRNKVSDKTRSLQKVLPWDKKMDQATLYEETYKYIKFLQAQISALQSMPLASPSSSSSSCSSNFGSENPRQFNPYGGLGKLNRQQLLEVLVNSPSAQTILYSKGCCIYSLEQLILFKDISEKKFFLSGPSVYT